MRIGATGVSVRRSLLELPATPTVRNLSVGEQQSAAGEHFAKHGQGLLDRCPGVRLQRGERDPGVVAVHGQLDQDGAHLLGLQPNLRATDARQDECADLVREGLRESRQADRDSDRGAARRMGTDRGRR